MKRVCNSDDFIAGEVETGFIDKHRDELFPATTVSDEVLAQAAISVILEDMVARQTSQSLFGSVKPSRTLPSGAVVGLGTGLAPEREMSFVTSPTPTRDFIGTTSIESDDGSDAREKKATAVIVRQKSSDTFDVAINGEARFFSVKSRLDRPSETLTSFFPGHTRLDSRIIRVDSNVGNLVGGEGGWPHDGIPCPSTTMHIFQRGQHHVLDLAGPSWITKALAHPSHSFFSRAEDAPRPSHAPKRHQDGTSTGTPQCTSDAAVTPGRDAEVANKRRTTAKIIPCPMPCKILRVHVAAGEQVERGQALLVIESMKMETVVRSPQTGTVQRVWAVGGVRSCSDHFPIPLPKLILFPSLLLTGVSSFLSCPPPPLPPIPLLPLPTLRQGYILQLAHTTLTSIHKPPLTSRPNDPPLGLLLPGSMQSRRSHG